MNSYSQDLFTCIVKDGRVNFAHFRAFLISEANSKQTYVVSIVLIIKILQKCHQFWEIWSPEITNCKHAQELSESRLEKFA